LNPGALITSIDCRSKGAPVLQPVARSAAHEGL